MATMRRLAPLLLTLVIACAHKGGPGPTGFKPAEVEAWLKKNVR